MVTTILTVGLAVYDLRHRRIPNTVVVPWLLFVLAKALFKGETAWAHWLMLLLFVLLWWAGVWGGGDAKLWSVLWLSTPPAVLLPTGIFVLGLCWLLPAIFGKERRRRIPGGWTAIPYALWLWYIAA